MEAATGRLVGAGQGGAEHHGIGAAGDGFGHVASVAHAAVGDDLHVVAGLEHVLGARRGHIGDRGGLGHADAQHAARGAGGPRADAHQHRGRAGAHQVQAGVVRGAAAHHDGDRQLAAELLEVQRWPRLVRGDVLGRDHRALDHEDVEPGLERILVVVAHALGGQRRRHHHAVLLDLGDALGDQLGLDRLSVDLLHLTRRDLLGELGDALELLVGVLVAGPDSLEVEHGEPAEFADDPRGLRRDHAVHRRREQRQLEAVGTEDPADVHVVRIPRAA